MKMKIVVTPLKSEETNTINKEYKKSVQHLGPTPQSQIQNKKKTIAIIVNI